MRVSEAVARRQSIRSFLPDPVPDDVLDRVLDRARFAPSGGNVQPWEAVVVRGRPLQALFDEVATRQAAGPMTEEYSSYPKNLEERWMNRRREAGGQLYDSVGIDRRDYAARDAQARLNFVAFGAPCLLIAHTPRFMGPPQWLDMGCWLQSVMLLLQEEGYDSCPQGAWAYVAAAARHVLGIPEDHVICGGVAIGKADFSHPVNAFRTNRAAVAETIRFVGSNDAR